MHERAHLEALLNALDASSRALRRDGCGDWHIKGKRGHILADGKGWLIVATDESIRRWTNVKRRLSFCRITQDGDDDGCLHLDRLPSAAEAELIRDAVHVKRKRQRVDLVVGGIAALLSIADQLLDGRGRKVEQQGFGTFILWHFFLLRHHVDFAWHESPRSTQYRWCG
jgi:hypothetical protein